MMVKHHSQKSLCMNPLMYQDFNLLKIMAILVLVFNFIMVRCFVDVNCVVKMIPRYLNSFTTSILYNISFLLFFLCLCPTPFLCNNFQVSLDDFVIL